MGITKGKWHKVGTEVRSQAGMILFKAYHHLPMNQSPLEKEANITAISAVPELLTAVESAIKVYIELGIKPDQSCYKLALEARDKALGL